MLIDVLKILLPGLVSFSIGIILAPVVNEYLEKFQVWKKKSVTTTFDGKVAEITQALHNDEKRHLPRMGGAVIWLSTILTALLFWGISHTIALPIPEKLDFISRNQTWLPIMGLIVGALVGGLDDLLVSEVFKNRLGTYIGGGLSFRVRLLAVSLMGLFAGWWFYTKLGVDAVYVPFYGHVHLGIFFILFFVLVTIALFSTSVIDGIDGLSGGIFTALFSSYGIIAFISHQVDIATLCFVLAGATMAFLWFNVPPALFMLGETGTMAILLSISIISFMTDAVLYLPIIALPLAATTVSVIVQLLSKKFLKRKVFLVAPLHHHFEAKGWPKHRIVMRYWIVSFICAMLGVVMFLIS